MLRWIILGWTAGPGVPDLKIEAESFDEALAKAREVDSRYSGGKIEDVPTPAAVDQQMIS
ncbi:MAG: hypothetical protein K2N78_12715 [Oscillospiraceae bacterium]|nr:hypothetical protein [Oscillospiraceae bacterium]